MTDQPFPDHEFLTVKELAALLRLKERKIYDLAASGAVPCSKATGKLLFPAVEIRQWIDEAKSGGLTRAGDQAPKAPRPAIVLGSHDPLFDWAIRQSRCGLACYYDGSLDGLDRFSQGEGLAAGLHIFDAQSGLWNVPAVAARASTQNAALIGFARRRRGLVFRSDGPALGTLGDLRGKRFAPRQPGSGTDILFQDMAAREDFALADLELTEVARTEDDAVDTVRRGEAEATFGLEAVAQSYGLAFTPLMEEEFSLLVCRKAWFDAPLQKLMAFCKTEAFAKRAASYGGYDISQLGTVLWNA